MLASNNLDVCLKYDTLTLSDDSQLKWKMAITKRGYTAKMKLLLPKHCQWPTADDPFNYLQSPI
jgi:hypothetical protein